MTGMIAPIPHFQPIPFPAPLWLLTLFLIVGFFLHALPMNVTLTGGLVAAIFMGRGYFNRDAYSLRLGQSLAKMLPYFISVAITQGIVPLLFLQLLYGPLFYTSSILMAFPWLMVIFLLLTAYYAYYFFTYHQKKLTLRMILLLVGAGILFLTIAFFFSNNMTLMLAPERWLALYKANPSGMNLNLGDPQLLPRYLHFVVASIAVTALTIGCFGLYWHHREEPYGSWLIKTAAGLYIPVTLLQIPVGIWFLLSLRPFIWHQFLGGNLYGTGTFVAAMVLDLIALGAMGLAWRDGRPGAFKTGLVFSLIVIFLMVIMRHLVRVYSTQSFFSPTQVAVSIQWVLLTFFLGGFVAVVFYLIWLIRILWHGFHPPGPRLSESEG
jgi:hypothetical protein